MTIPDDYQRIRAHAVVATVAPRGLLVLSGRDRGTYLHGLLTNDTAALKPGTGCYAAWLTANGRMTTDMHVLESGDTILLDVPEAEAAGLVARLDQFIFTEDVRVADVSQELRRIEVHGPEAARAVAEALGNPEALGELAAWAQCRNARVPRDAGAVVVTRIDRLGVPGFVLYVAAGEDTALRAALDAAGATAVRPEAVEAVRVEAGWPVYGVDMDDQIIPLEAGIESRAISMTKGCYVGQEIIVRVLHRGHGRVAKRLVGLRVEGDGPVAHGEKLDVGAHEVGWVTSSAVSPTLGSIALAYLHRDHAKPGTSVTTASGRGAVVSALPMN
jgi:folate-binding protein YgfZ